MDELRERTINLTLNRLVSIPTQAASRVGEESLAGIYTNHFDSLSIGSTNVLSIEHREEINFVRKREEEFTPRLLSTAQNKLSLE